MRVRLALLALLLVAVAAACDSTASPAEDGGDQVQTLPAASPAL